MNAYTVLDGGFERRKDDEAEDQQLKRLVSLSLENGTGKETRVGHVFKVYYLFQSSAPVGREEDHPENDDSFCDGFLLLAPSPLPYTNVLDADGTNDQETSFGTTSASNPHPLQHWPPALVNFIRLYPSFWSTTLQLPSKRLTVVLTIPVMQGNDVRGGCEEALGGEEGCDWVLPVSVHVIFVSVFEYGR
ncbi:hypothetical protein D9758_016618 [Tetrapyrgos nigripes]|uniref:Uncharacterized protein n=1 Tax=Tetrapyrgos nigripes TaxID=182062 RepID=A0A8H5C9T8_9AGAR|nr:hypothetical protein D9758_016618 [Tetrapyrgos nigripes]